MKKYLFYGMMGAIALTFNACSSDDEVVNPNPTFDGENVKTSFTISVGDLGDGTRMTDVAVQKDEKFKGMKDIYLFPAKEAITGDTKTTESYINLPNFEEFSTEVAKAQGKIYKDVSFSIGVNNFLFYAASQATTTGKLKASYLKLDDWAAEPLLNEAGTSSTIKDIHFDLVPIQRGKGLDDLATAGATTIAPLNAAYAALVAQITAATTADATAAAAELQKIADVLKNKVGTDYKAYAGSSASQKALLTRLYNAVNSGKAVITDTYAEPILNAIKEYFNATGSDEEGYTLAWKDDPKFPADALELPDGAAAVKYDEGENKFAYCLPSVEGMEVDAIDKYTYPASLYYTVNSPAMVKDAEYLQTLNDEKATWADVRTDGEYTEGAITASTRSVILKDQVQYAVGRLDVAVRVKPEVVITDNGSGIEGDAVQNPQPVTVPADGYKLTGVLIGTQKGVDWEFKPVGTDELTIWDNTMTSEIYAKQQEAYSDYNRTLALETKVAEAAGEGKVKIALEFENSANDFYGVDHNIIPAGTKFYLVAELDPSTNTTVYKQDPETPWAENAELIKQVFLQDYVTTVNLTIGEESLRNAYNVIPDLRSQKLEFGLSVDLHWRKGITFEQEFK